MTEFACQSDEFFNQYIVVVGRHKRVWLKSCLAECITPACPELPAPLVNLYPGFFGEPLAAKRYAAVRVGGALDFVQNVLFVHGIYNLRLCRRGVNLKPKSCV